MGKGKGKKGRRGGGREGNERVHLTHFAFQTLAALELFELDNLSGHMPFQLQTNGIRALNSDFNYITLNNINRTIKCELIRLKAVKCQEHSYQTNLYQSNFFKRQK